MTFTDTMLADLFGRVSGSITLHDADGTQFSSADFHDLAAAADGMSDPWVDLVSSDGFAIGLYVAGDAGSVAPKPSIVMSDGMVYMFDGDAVPDQKRGINLCPLGLLVDPDALDWYLPADIDLCTPSTHRTIKLSQGRKRDEKQGGWKLQQSEFGQFAEYIQIHREGGKDGPCFLQGECAGGTRKAAAMVANDILGVDLDSGAPLEDVIATIQRNGLEAVIYTTHSHLKDTTVIKRDHFFKWSGETDVTNEDTVRDYLIAVKGVLPQIVENLTVLDDALHTEDGVVILVKHAPMPKFRAVFPLSEPFNFSKRGGTQVDAIAEWKERYAGFCTDLKLFFDEKCVDPARLFYFPRHTKGAVGCGSWHIVGAPLNLDDHERVKMKRGRDGKRTAVSTNAFTSAGDGEDEDDADRYVTESGYNLRAWAAKNAKRFEIQTLYDDLLPDDTREGRGTKAGIHIACPFEAEHTSFGGGGTYVVNASDNLEDGWEAGFTIHCTHNACSGRDRLDFLKALCDDKMIEVGDLSKKDYLLALEGDEEEEDEPTAANRFDPEDAPVRGRDRDRAVNAGAGIGYDATDEEDDNFGDDEVTMLKAFNRRYAVIVTSGGVKILREPSGHGEDDDDVKFLTQNDVALLERTRNFFRAGADKKMVKVEGFKAWLEWEHRRTYNGVVFAPGRQTPRSVYNLFRGWPYDAVQGKWNLLRDHIYENMCDKDDVRFDWFMTFLAHIFQKPESKPGSTVVITGEKGVGKSTLFDYVNRLLGRHGITVAQRKQIVGQFNGHLATTLLMVCEEAFWAADAQAEGVLKDMITNKSVLIEKKGYDPVQSSNYTRLALISNSEWVVPATLKDERRFFVLNCNSTRRGDLVFFGKLKKQMEEEGGLEAMMFELMNWKPVHGTWASLFTPPVTVHLQKQQIESLNGVQKFMLELVKSGLYEMNEDKGTSIELNEDRETMIGALEMRAAIEDYVRFRFQSDKAKTSFDDISVVVIDWFGARETKTAGSVNKKRMFVFPPLTEVRKKLKETKGLDIVAMDEEDFKAIRKA